MEKFLWQPAIEDEPVDVTRRVRPVPVPGAQADHRKFRKGKERKLFERAMEEDGQGGSPF